MNRNISEAHKNEYNPLYYSVDITKAQLPSLVDFNSMKEDIRQEVFENETVTTAEITLH